jgi:hypothetical protein
VRENAESDNSNRRSEDNTDCQVVPAVQGNVIFTKGVVYILVWPGMKIESNGAAVRLERLYAA